MKLLILTQKVDTDDPILGFFHEWIARFSEKLESVSVICLQKGKYNLPNNVTVYSLGKENKGSKFKYILNFYRYLFLIRGSYDKVFVHMNEEYVLLAGWYWRLIGVPVYLWRNHPKGNVFTRIAVAFSTKVMATSKDSFTARFKKTEIMPVGYDEKIFRPMPNVVRKKYSVLMLGRISPVKHIELAIEAVEHLVNSGTQVTLSIFGNILDPEYYRYIVEMVSEKNLSHVISFEGEIDKSKSPEVFNSYEITLNLTESGSFDKTIAEAAACGSIPLVSNSSLRRILPDECITEPNPERIANAIQKLFNAHKQVEIAEKLKKFTASQSLFVLMEKFVEEMK